MKSAEARAIVAELGLEDAVRELVDGAPPLPAEAAALWRGLVRVSEERRVATG